MKSSWIIERRWFRVILVVAYLIAIPFAAYASDVSGALWRGVVRVTNSSNTTATAVSTNMTLSVQGLIDAGYADNATDIVLQSDGSDILFMPGYLTNPWAIFVDSIGAGLNTDFDLYTGNVTGGDLRYFPGSGGMTINDSADMEVADNFTIQLDGWIDTSSVSDNVVGKAGAFRLYVSASGNLTAQIRKANIEYKAGENDTLETNDSTARWFGNTFTTIDAITITAVEIKVFKEGNPGDFVLTIYPTIAGEPDETIPLTTGTYDGDTLGGSPGVYAVVDITDYLLSANTTYAVILSGPNVSVGNNVWWRFDSTGAAYSGGMQWSTNDSGVNWTSAAGNDMMFSVHGVEAITATGITSGEYELIVNRTSNFNPVYATGDVPHYNETADSSINFGQIHDNIAKLWVSLWFRLDTPYSSANSTDVYLWYKRLSPNESVGLRLRQGSGTMRFELYESGVGRSILDAAPTSWNADQWYHVIASISDTTPEQRLIVDGVVVTENNAHYNTPNGGILSIGNIYENGNRALRGEVRDVVIGTDNLTEAEEAGLLIGIIPSDANNIWFMSEGSGTAIVDYGTDGDDWTTDSAITWETSTYTGNQTGRLSNFSIAVGSSRWGTNITANVTDNANDWAIGSDATPYIEQYQHTVDEALVSDISWEYGATFTDASGNGNDATPTYRIVSSSANVSAVLLSFGPTSTSEIATYDLTDTYAILSGSVNVPGGMYTELDLGNLPAAPITEMLTDADVPAAAWWFPFLFLGICVIGLITYGATTLTRGPRGNLHEGGVDGSLLTQFVVMEFLLVALGLMGPIPLWPAFLFPIAGISLILSRKHFSWG